MVARLGKLLWWASILTAGCWVAFSFELAEHYPPITYGIAFIILLVGLAARFMLDSGKQA
jgi:hypothetical protein